MKVCFVTGRELSYPRNQILKKAFEKNSIEVIICSVNKRSNLNSFYVMKNFLSYHKKCDIIFVGFFGQHMLPFIKKISDKPIVFDPFVSIYDTLLYDKKIIKNYRIISKFLHGLDEYSCSISDHVILDTMEHIKFFNQEFNVDLKKMSRIFVGADEDVFYPRETQREDDDFIIEFHGEYIPLQGTEYIIKAAKLLENYKDIKFIMIGKGQEFYRNLSLAKKLNIKNINFKDYQPYGLLPKYISNADIGLGIFGDTLKAQRVIPNKAYQVIAMKKPLITSDTPAVRELLVDGKDAILCKRANPESLANAILYLKKDKELRDRIAENGFNTFKKSCTLDIISKQLIKIIDKLNNGQIP